MLNLQFLGAARSTTGSMHLVEYAGKKILLDCGLFQGHRKEAFEINRNFPLEPREIDAIVLSHAHIDHLLGICLADTHNHMGSPFM